MERKQSEATLDLRVRDGGVQSMTEKTGPGQAPGLVSQYPVRREGIRPNATTMLIGSKKNVPSSTKEKMLYEKRHVIIVDVKYIRHVFQENGVNLL